MVALVLGAVSVASGQTPEQRLIALEAAFVPKLAKYVDWPAGTFAGDKTPLVIGVLGRDPFGPLLDRIVAGATVRGRTIEIRRIASLADAADADADADADHGGRERITAQMRRCQVLFVSESERGRLGQIREILVGASVLTISDIPSFARNGGIIELVRADGQIVFHINHAAAERAGLRIDSKLMRLARKVYREDR